MSSLRTLCLTSTALVFFSLATTDAWAGDDEDDDVIDLDAPLDVEELPQADDLDESLDDIMSGGFDEEPDPDSRKERLAGTDESELDFDDLDMDLEEPREGMNEFDELDEFGPDEELEEFEEFEEFDEPEEDLGDMRDLGEFELLDEPTEAEAARRGLKPSTYGLSMSEARPLADNWDGEVVAKGPDAVVVELPVLVTKRPEDFHGETTWIVARFMVDGARKGEQRHVVHSTTIADVGATVVWVKAHVPVLEPKGIVDITISQEFPDGDEVELYTRSIRY